ncbi:MAG: hypothetical protein COW54_01990 [Rhodobacteraceae bacterium CG17_big_fil_post_rev_8_21_14_2_50_63_15]|nr:hypothetical protein [Roseovarius sp.]PIV79837.1 MAG: hypothetical protein COW54_01990 [Rhodobacteraceae bacterium CG17_big_fil_post_rev_8_21_14_2_50_63_15]
MVLSGLVTVLSGAGVLVTGLLSVLFLRDPVAGMAATAHRLERLPQVMANRYGAMFALALAATLYGDLKVIALLFATFAYMGFSDAWIYGRAGSGIAKHVGAGSAALIVVLVAVLAMGWPA